MSLGTSSMPSLLRRLERGELTSVPHSLHGHLSHIPRMWRTDTLRGHDGCVNRLAFSDEGDKLISASDDCTLRIWDVASLSERVVLAPGHFSNVFGVAFMPSTSDGYVVSAGLDFQVRHTNVHTAASTLWTCHNHVVKTVTAVTPHVFISASKDGTARQFDVRVPPYHPKYKASNVIVRIIGRNRRPRGLNSAVVSPLSENHLLVAGCEPCLRVFDRRKCGSFVERTEDDDDDQALHASSIGDCIEKLTPPHMHETAPETGTIGGGRKKTYATFATYSPDAKQVVASFYDDLVHVFDLPQHQQAISCRKPFLSRAQHKAAVFRFVQDAAAHSAADRHSAALGKANRVLELVPDHLFALVVKAEALARRHSFGDLRSSFATLSHICKLIQDDHTRIAELWGTHTADGDLCLSPDSECCAQKAEIWLKVFKFMQASALFRMNPPQQIRLLQSGHARGEFTRKRLEHLDLLTGELKKFVDAKLHPTSQEISRNKALGNSAERSRLYSTAASKLRGDILQRMFDVFYQGLPALRQGIQTSLAYLVDLGDGPDLACGSVDCSSTDSDEYLAEEKMEALGLFEKLRHQQVTNGVDDGFNNLWGPPPSAQEGWRCFYGHTSIQTDIKEARFYGAQNQVVLSGSDDGMVYMWATKTGELLRRIHGDDQIVNCVLPHPTRSMIINSGIDTTIKVVTPQGKPASA